jgi:hypothetical protein
VLGSDFEVEKGELMKLKRVLAALLFATLLVAPIGTNRFGFSSG